VAKLTGIPEVGFRGDLEKGVTETLKHHAGQLARAAVGKSTWQEERIRLTPKSVLVIDEAGMVGTRHMERLTEQVVKAGARLVLVGDEKQLQAIEAGGPFASIGSRIGRVTMTEIQRQRDPWAREAVKKFAQGQATEALREYAARGFVTVSEDRKEAMQALIKEWRREGVSRPKDHLILASTNADTAVLNRMAQLERILADELGKRSLRVGSFDFRGGDRVLFTRNSKLFGVENGCLGTVLGVDPVHETLVVKLDKGKRVIIPARDYEHLRPGYAVTAYKAQGLTAEHCYVLLGGPTQDRELSYVQASRARNSTRFFIDKLEAGDRLKDLCKQMERSRQKDLAIDILQDQRRENLR
jgi:ATP-dependent exoDNAse (exonuclease V) alpha subunit